MEFLDLGFPVLSTFAKTPLPKPTGGSANTLVYSMSAYLVVHVVNVHTAADALHPQHVAAVRVVLLVLVDQPAKK